MWPCVSTSVCRRVKIHIDESKSVLHPIYNEQFYFSTVMYVFVSVNTERGKTAHVRPL